MPTIFGDFIEFFPPEQDSLELQFTPSSYSIRKRWHSHRLSAQFIAEYFTNFLPIEEGLPLSERRIRESKGAVSYIANELLENAMKFNDETSLYKVRFGIHFIGDSAMTAAIFATNSIKPGCVDSFQSFIKVLLAGDPSVLYLQQIEKSAEANDGTSGLGLLTMIQDYGAKVGWRFETIEGHRPTMTVTTMAQIAVQ